jgi:hypothetical protein
MSFLRPERFGQLISENSGVAVFDSVWIAASSRIRQAECYRTDLCDRIRGNLPVRGVKRCLEL